MMYGMMGGMIWASLVSVVLMLGAAYVIWVLAVKEAGNLKTAGQVIAGIIAVIAAVTLLYGTIYGGMMGRGCWSGSGRGYKKMMSPKMMEKMGGYVREGPDGIHAKDDG
ncbi:hypothetical protein ACFL4J_02050 [Candidatus Margulisiibacteriota bacterium]